MDDLLTRVNAVLSTTVSRWQTLAEVIPVEMLSLRPEPNEWSALECLQHLVETDQLVFPIRIQAFLNNQNFPGFNPDTNKKEPGTPSPTTLVKIFSQIRQANLELLAKLTPSDLLRTAQHGELGKVTLSEMLNEWAGHDLMHTVQAERAMMQPFIKDCGPWRSYFADHDVEKQMEIVKDFGSINYDQSYDYKQQRKKV